MTYPDIIDWIILIRWSKWINNVEIRSGSESRVFGGVFDPIYCSGSYSYSSVLIPIWAVSDSAYCNVHINTNAHKQSYTPLIGTATHPWRRRRRRRRQNHLRNSVFVLLIFDMFFFLSLPFYLCSINAPFIRWVPVHKIASLARTQTHSDQNK